MNNKKMQKLWGAFRSLSVSSSTKQDGSLLSDDDGKCGWGGGCWGERLSINKGSVARICIIPTNTGGDEQKCCVLFAIKKRVVTANNYQMDVFHT